MSTTKNQEKIHRQLPKHDHLDWGLSLGSLQLLHLIISVEKLTEYSVETGKFIVEYIPEE